MVSPLALAPEERHPSGPLCLNRQLMKSTDAEEIDTRTGTRETGKPKLEGIELRDL